ncbi:MAG: NADH:flavin oxidoreductase/NADH oxidase [Betaproteobacteria bacterium]|nr:NADH:flavin oxidoreductase/NADH oxidase [Betaproteobacteria bacterium]
MSSALFSPFKLRGLALPNRIVVSPMCQYSAEDGNATDWHLQHWASMAISGAGLFIIEATHVTRDGRITPGCMGLYSDANEAAFKRALDSVRKHNPPSYIGVQLAHAGRKASSHRPWEGGQLIPANQPDGWQPVGPSAVSHMPGEAPPRELTRDEILGLVDSFVTAAQRCERLGLDAIELHGAHGYLMHQFLSPISNKRTDDFGGSLENRMRFPLMVYDAVRKVWPAHKPLGVRVSTTDWVEGGWDVEECIVFAKELHKRGCDWIDCSSGGVDPARQKIALSAGYQVPNAEKVKQAVPGVPTIAVGLITEAAHAEEIVASGKADLVALARGLLYNPRWPWHAAAALGATVVAPPQYWRSAPREHAKVLGDTKIGSR